jgi:hypothetical protein
MMRGTAAHIIVATTRASAANLLMRSEVAGLLRRVRVYVRTRVLFEYVLEDGHTRMQDVNARTPSTYDWFLLAQHTLSRSTLIVSQFTSGQQHQQRIPQPARSSS